MAISPPRRQHKSDISDTILVVGATLRLIRLVVSDDLVQWWVKDPLEDRAKAQMDRTNEIPKWYRYLSGLNCPFCVGTWIGFGVLGVSAMTRDTGLERPWRFVMSGLTLNEISAHLGLRLGDYGHDEYSES